MKNKRQIEIEKEIVSRVKTEMDLPRLTQSVRNGFSAQPESAEEKPAARPQRA
jgi:hypothetical protein